MDGEMTARNYFHSQTIVAFHLQNFLTYTNQSKVLVSRECYSLFVP